MNWDDPADRAELIMRVGHKEYGRLQTAHFDSITIETVNGYPIRPTQSAFGKLFMIVGTTMAYRELDRAVAHAKELPKAGE